MDCTNCAWKTDREACRSCRQEQEADGLEPLADARARTQTRLDELLGGRTALAQAEEILERSRYHPDPRD